MCFLYFYRHLGLEFDVLFLSTVRTSRILGPGEHEGKDLGFLSNPKLLNTAITRAKFCLVVVGDPKGLCSVGDCRVCWKTILSLCSENGTFHYRVPLTEVLSSIREEQTQMVKLQFSNSFQTPHQQPYVAPSTYPPYGGPPFPAVHPFFPVPMGPVSQVPPVTPMMLPLGHPSYVPHPQHFALPRPLHHQNQIPVPVPVPRYVSGGHIIGSIPNIHSNSKVKLPPTISQKGMSPILPRNHSRMSVGLHSYTARDHMIDSAMKIAATDVNLQAAFREGDFQSRRPQAPSSTSDYDTSGGIVTSEGKPTGPKGVDAFKSQYSETTIPFCGGSKHQHPNGNRMQIDSQFRNNSRSSSGLLLTTDSEFDVDVSHHNAAGAESGYRNDIEDGQELSLSGQRDISPTQHSEELFIMALYETLRNNISGNLRNITESEEEVNMFIENPLEDTSDEVKENLVSQVSLLQQMKSALEQQQILNRTLAKSIRSLQESGKQLNVNYAKEKALSLTPRLTHVHKIDLDSDNEVQEWYRLRQQDPIVQDYIKSFEVLSERARIRGIQDIEMTESCDISDGSNTELTRSLRGWLLQPQSVVCPTGNLLYEEYLTPEEVAKKVENGELIAATISIEKSPSGKSAICVVDDPLEMNIFIPDRWSMNRAFNMDYVAVEVTQEVQDSREGKVVAILQERHRRQVVCRLISSESTVMIPVNSKNPKFSILQSDNHVGQTGVAVFDTQGNQIQFSHFVSDVEDRLFLVQYLKWDVSYRYPLGFVAKCFDKHNDIDSLIPILCSDYGVPNGFPVAVTEEIETRFPEDWRVPDMELKSRCRYEDAFTIDCQGAEELDDAISVRPLKYGIYSVTIHVADVSYFVSKDSMVDKEAKERASSVYLTESNISFTLLPKQLSPFCSLVPGKERLAVSIEFVIDSSGKIRRSPIFRRSVIVSKRQLSFEEVDGFLLNLGSAGLRTSSSPLLFSLQVLHCLSRELWARRVRAGSFQACTESSLQSPSRRIVEELMIITNMAVAKKLTNFPDSHVVPYRIQQLPRYTALQSVASWAAEKDLNLDEIWLTQFLTG